MLMCSLCTQQAKPIGIGFARLRGENMQAVEYKKHDYSNISYRLLLKVVINNTVL